MRRLAQAGALAAGAAPGRLACYLLATIVSAAIPVALAWLTKLLLDGITGGAAGQTVLGYGAALGLLGLAAAIVPQAIGYLRAELDREVGLLARDRLFAAVERFVGLGRFEQPSFLDRLRLAEQGLMTPNQALDGALGVTRAALTLAGFLGSLAIVSPLMTVLVLAAGAPVLVAEVQLARRRVRMYWAVGPAERREFFYSELLTSVQAAKEIRLFGVGPFLRARMLAERRTANTMKRAVDRRELLVQSGLGAAAALLAAAGLVWAAGEALRGGLTVGDVTMFVAAVAGVQGTLSQLAAELARSHQALLVFGHYCEVTTARPDLPIAAAAASPPPLRSAIVFEDVWFRYSEDHPWILRGVNLTIPCGRAVGLVGRNGAGKSTVVKLLCRFYDPTRGVIRWDGTDIRELDPVALRNRVSAVFQDYMQYEMTAAENIALGDLDALADEPRLRTGARRAGIHTDLAALPHGYGTLLSRRFFMESDKNDPETGVVLSGGQWQRLALARAFVRDRRELMILDEPSSGLDAHAEHEIHTSLRRHRAGQTSLLVSHRLSAVKDADQIVVLAGGRVAEEGTHGELMALGGEYAGLFSVQAAGYAPGLVAQ